MKKSIKQIMKSGAVMLALSLAFTSCEDILGEWDKPAPAVVTPSEPETPATPEEIIYAFSLRNLADDADVTAALFKLTDQNGTEIAYATSDGKYTIKADDLSSVTTLWLEVTSDADKKYIAKATVEELPAIAEAGKLKMATLGDVILSDGKFAVDGTEGQLAMIAYLGDGDDSDATYNHGLALALKDANNGSAAKWCSQRSETCLGTGHQFGSLAGAKGDMAGIDNTDYLINHAPTGHTHDAASEARGYNGGTYPDGTSAWFLPSAGQWDKMATAAGGYANLKTNAGLQSDHYWSSSEVDSDNAWRYVFDSGSLSIDSKDSGNQVRACLAF